jgi:DNA-binding NtrC family response regulator
LPSSRRSQPTSKASSPNRQLHPLRFKKRQLTQDRHYSARKQLCPRTVEVKSGSFGIPAIDGEGDIRPLDEIEADMIRLALGRYRGHMTEVARRSKIGRSTLYRKMQEYGLELVLRRE